jgi:DNA/RNA-binding domain of Phe-tRNA-synthetase-like protein
MWTVDAHPLLDARGFSARWPAPLEALAVPAWAAQAGPEDHEAHTEQVRALLRHGGFKPAGRNKPCNEYIRKAAAEGNFPRINAVVDLTNVAVLRHGLPISTVDLDLLEGPLRVGVAEAGASYVFNRSGQVLDLGGLLCLFDAQGPCANAVKDSQRTKTHPGTLRTLTVIWGTRAWPGQAERTRDWMLEQARGLGAEIIGAI